MVAQRLPTFFGRLSVLLSEHEKLAVTLADLRQISCLLAAGQLSLPSDLAPARVLGELRREVSQHFAAEETDAHFGMIAKERPDLLPQVVDLKTDHTTLLEALAALDRTADDVHRWRDFPALAERLLAALDAHEAAEAELVDAFISPAGAQA